MGRHGSGLSSSLKYCALQAIEDPDAPVPIYLDLEGFSTENTPGALAQAAIYRATEGSKESIEIFEREDRRNGILWLIDNANLSKLPWEHVENQIRQLNGYVFVTISSSYFNPLLLQDWPQYQLLGLEEKELEKFFFKHLLLRSSDEVTARERAKLLLNDLRGCPQLWDYTLLPFNAALLASISSKPIPTCISELYSRVFFENLPSDSPEIQLLSSFAWQVRSKNIGHVDLLKDIQEECNTKTEPKNFLTKLQKLGILHVNNETIRFSKKQWLEFSAALYLRRLIENNCIDYFKEKLLPLVHHRANRPIFVLALGLLKDSLAMEILKILVKGFNPYDRYLKRDLRLAADVIVASPSIEEKVPLIQKPLSSLVSPKQWSYALILTLSFLLGLYLIISYSPQSILGHFVLLWLSLWLLAFCLPYFPIFRDSFALPSRYFKKPPDTSPFILSSLGLGNYSLPILIAATKTHQNPLGQRMAIRRLGDLKLEEAANPLCELLMDLNAMSSVRTEAARALGKIAVPSSVAPLSKAFRSKSAEFDTRYEAAHALAKISTDEAFDKLKEGLDHQDHRIRILSSSAIAFSFNAQKSICKLIDLCEDCFPEVRLAAVESLAVLKDPSSIAALTKRLGDHNAQISKEAAKALGAFGSAALPFIRRCLDDGDTELEEKQSAIEGLGHIDSSEVVDICSVLMAREEHQIRKKLVDALLHCDSSQSIELLKQAVADEWPTVRAKALQSLTEKLGNDARPYLLEALRDKSRSVRRKAIASLNSLRTQGVEEDLLITLDDSDFEVRRDGAKALGELGSKVATQKLYVTCKDVNSLVREASFRALGKIHDLGSTKVILEGIFDLEADVRWAAAEAIASFGVRHSSSLFRELLASNEVIVRRNVITALGTSGDSDALELLTEALSDSDREVRCSAASALSRIASSSVETSLIPLLADESSIVRAQAAITLGNVGTDRSTVPLIENLTDKEDYVRKASAQALGKLKVESAIPSLSLLIDDTNWDVRTTAAKAIAEISCPLGIEALSICIESLDPAMRSHSIDCLDLLSEKLNSRKDLERIADILWWRLTDEKFIAIKAFQTLDRVGNRIASLY